MSYSSPLGGSDSYRKGGAKKGIDILKVLLRKPLSYLVRLPDYVVSMQQFVRLMAVRLVEELFIDRQNFRILV